MNIYMREKRRPFELYPIRTYVIIQLRHDSLNKTPRRMKKKEKEKETFVKIKTIPNDQPLRSIQLSSKERNILANDNEQTSSRFDKKNVSHDAYELTDWQSGKKRIRRKILRWEGNRKREAGKKK